MLHANPPLNHAMVALRSILKNLECFEIYVGCDGVSKRRIYYPPSKSIVESPNNHFEIYAGGSTRKLGVLGDCIGCNPIVDIAKAGQSFFFAKDTIQACAGTHTFYR